MDISFFMHSFNLLIDGWKVDKKLTINLRKFQNNELKVVLRL